MTQLEVFKAKYSKRSPEAVRSLAEDEEHLLTFYEFPMSMHRHIQTTNAIESLFSNVRQRTDFDNRVNGIVKVGTGSPSAFCSILPGFCSLSYGE